MSLSTPRELFLHELADTMSSERIILGMLPELQKESRDAEAKTAFKDHEAETKQQVKNLDAIFKQLNEKPGPAASPATEGLKKGHEALHKASPSPEVLQMGLLGGASKTEHFEIANYTLLVQMAKDLDEPETARLLQENLAQEQAMAKRVEAISKRLGKDAKAVASAAKASSKAANGAAASSSSKAANGASTKAGTIMNAADVKGIPVISIAEGEKVGAIDRIYVDFTTKKLVGFESSESGGMLDPGASFKIDPNEVVSIGPDALTIESRAAATGRKTLARMGSLQDIDEVLKRKVVTESGSELGAVASVAFDDKQFTLTRIDVSPGVFKSNLTIQIADVVTFGTDRVIVTDAAVPVAEQPEPAEAPATSAA